MMKWPADISFMALAATLGGIFLVWVLLEIAR